VTGQMAGTGATEAGFLPAKARTRMGI